MPLWNTLVWFISLMIIPKMFTILTYYHVGWLRYINMLQSIPEKKGCYLWMCVCAYISVFLSVHQGSCIRQNIEFTVKNYSPPDCLFLFIMFLRDKLSLTISIFLFFLKIPSGIQIVCLHTISWFITFRQYLFTPLCKNWRFIHSIIFPSYLPQMFDDYISIFISSIAHFYNF